MSDLPGTNAIEYYLKGVAIKQQREHYQLQRQAQQEELEQKRKALEQNFKISEIKFNELKSFHDATVNNWKSNLELAIKKQRLQDYTSIAKGEAEFDPENPGEIRATKPGTAGQVKANEAALIEEAKTPATVDRARQIGNITLNNDLLKIANQFKNQYDLQDFRLKKESEENEKDRATRLQIANANLAEKRARREDENEALNFHTDAYTKAIESGDVTREQLSLLPTKEKSKILGNITNNKIVLLDNKSKDRFNSVRSLINYANKSDWAQKRMAGRSAQENFRDKELQTVLSELDSQGKIFATEIQGDKSILSERELPRLREGTVQTNPVGWRLFDRFTDSDKVNDQANARRVNEFKDIVKKNLKSLIGNAPESQWKSLGEKYGFDYNPYEEERRKLNKKTETPSNGQSNGSRQFPDHVKDVK